MRRSSKSPTRTRRCARIAAEQLTSLLVFRAGSAQPKAVPLALITRLEEIAIDKIEKSNGRHMVQYRDQLMPLVQMDGVSIATEFIFIYLMQCTKYNIRYLRCSFRYSNY